MIVADTGPLIAFARTGNLHLLEKLFSEIWIPHGVYVEIGPKSDKPGARVIVSAIQKGWIKITDPIDLRQFPPLLPAVDAGESEAIYLALTKKARALLMDDKKGRQAARKLGLQILGSGGILIQAKARGLIEQVGPFLQAFQEAGYRFSNELRQKILRLAEEASQ